MPRQPPPCSCAELQLRARALEGVDVGSLAAALGEPLPQSPQRAKGFVGQLAELALGADADAYDRPDFVALGVELKSIPVDAQGRPRESTFCCSIRMAAAPSATWEGSRLKRRLACVLWLPVVTTKEQSLAARRFGRARLWRPSAATWALLRADWEQLMGMLGAGQGGLLTAHKGELLQVRPKAANARQRTLGQDGDGPAAVAPMGFYLRPSFTAAILAGDS